MLNSLDVIIAGFHEPVFAPHDKETNTRAMIATMASGNVHIISHPGNPKYPVDITAIAQAAAKYRWRWKSITRHSCIRAKAVKIIAARWPQPCVTLADGWR